VIVVFDPIISMEDVPRPQALLTGELPSASERLKPAIRGAN
jgi:hypothetical protein